MATFLKSWGNRHRLQKYHLTALQRGFPADRNGPRDNQAYPRHDFNRETETWWLLDAAGLQVDEVATIATHYLLGMSRPDFNPRQVITPDQVVVINCRDAVMVGDNWSREPVTWRSNFPSGKYRVRASEVYERDPCMLVYRKVTTNVRHYLFSPTKISKLDRSYAAMEFLWLYEDAVHPHADEAPRPIRWVGQKEGQTYKFDRMTRWWANPYLS